MAFKDNEKDTFSFDDLASDFDEKKNINNKPTNIDNDVDELDELFITTSSASAISDLVSKNNEDVDSDDEERRKKLIAEIESELNGNSGKTGAIKTVNKPIKKAEVKKNKKTIAPTDNSKEQLLAQRQMELDNIMKEIGIEEGTFSTKSEDIQEEQEEQEERKEIIEKSKVIEKPTTPIKKPVKNGIEVNEFLTTKNIIIISIMVCLLLLIAVIISMLLNKDTKNNAVLSTKDKIIIKSPANKYVMTFGDVSSRVSIENIRMNNAYEYFTKIKVKVKNKKNGTANMRNANDFVLIGVNNEKISTCLTSSDLTNYNVKDALPSTIPAKTTVEGYLYCKTDITYLPKLQITALRTIDESAAQRGEIVGLSAYQYIVNLDA